MQTAGSTTKLAYILEAFDLQVMRLALILNIPRQELALWLQGQTPPVEHQSKIANLYTAAMRFKEAGLEGDYQTKHNLIGGELEFVEALGQDPLAAVETLIEVTRRGQEERAWLEQLLAGRPAPEGSIWDELPPHYPEE